MCGLFGFIGESPQPGKLKRAALEASRRGPHAFGLAWLAGSGVQIYRQRGRLDQHLNEVDRVALAPALIGLARLATSGEWQDEANNQPLIGGGLVVAHNGNVYNDQALFADYGYTPATRNDSEAILAILVNGPGALAERLERVLREVDPRSPLAALVLDGGQIHAIRRGHPIYSWVQPEGLYFCSRPLAIGARLLADGTVTTWQTPAL